MTASGHIGVVRFGFGAIAGAAQPELERLPVDCGDDLEGQQRPRQRGPQQGGGGQRSALAGQRGGDAQRLTAVVVQPDTHAQALVGIQKMKAIAAVTIEKGRDVKPLGLVRRDLRTHRRTLGVEYVEVMLAESVVDLGDDRAQPAVGVLAVEQAERIEAIAEHPRHRQQAHAAAGQGHAAIGQQCLQPRPQRTAVVRAMVGVVERQPVETIAREQRRGRAGGVDRVDVQQQVPRPVAETIARRARPPVHDAGNVERVCRHHRRQATRAPSPSATRTAAARPSS
ncbi:hypothetical protein SAHL_08855 [Salinisphaera orenii YIM 95161]|uniref:Uncharacterized protein n=1 Tax=Salinisphaera orenii YIM 95161 TaxID=1051139 RepID=A0A423PVI3_9GAMM|nr:hypothetical protein SAHL_08855 [Salinisphaera halophila YIM 95161]